MKKFMLICMIYMISCFPVQTVFAAEMPPPEVTAQGAILMDAVTGRILWAKNADAPLAMASTTKMMTVLVALEHGDLDDIVTVSKNAAQTPPVKMYLSDGEQVELRGLLYALMLQSSNDAAVAVAEHVGGSVAAFCGMMTEEAAALGAKDTVFETPNGLDFGDHHSTAYDLAVIARHALQNEDFMFITNTPYITVKSNLRAYRIDNRNRLLSEFKGGNGIKTGYTGKAGHCFVGAAKRGDMQLISVVLASGWGSNGREQKWIDTKRILNYGFDNYEYETLVAAGEPVGEITVKRSQSKQIGVCFAEALVLPVTQNERDNLKVAVYLPKFIKAPIAKNTKIGRARLFIGNEFCKEIALLTSGEVERFDIKTCAETVLSTFAQMGTNNRTKITLPELGSR